MTEELPLCWCLHFEGQHKRLGTIHRETGLSMDRCEAAGCGCLHFSPISHTSSHAYRRGQRVRRRRVDCLRADDRVMVAATRSGALCHAPRTTGALVARVTEIMPQNGSQGTEWAVLTDLGRIPAEPGTHLAKVVT